MMDNLDEACAEDIVHPLQHDQTDDHVGPEAFRVIEDIPTALQEEPCIAYISALQDLAPDMKCATCKKPCNVAVKKVGSAVVLFWVCISQQMSCTV